MTPIVLEGLPALSPFRRERLQARLQAVAPGLRVLGAWHAYWIEPEAGAVPDPAALQRILQAAPDFQPAAPGATSRFVLPRLGTISPWRARRPNCCTGRDCR